MKEAASGLAEDFNLAFPHKVCINLDRRPERWEKVQREFDRHAIRDVRRSAARDGKDLKVPDGWTHTGGALGCLESHLAVVREARQKDLPHVLIFEDDVIFDPGFVRKFAERIREVPGTWDMLFFGALHKDEPLTVSPHLARLTRSNSTYAYAIRQTAYDAFIELNSNSVDVIDVNNYQLQERFDCFCFIPHLAWVDSDYSDAQNRAERHWYLKESLVLFGAGVDRLLSETAIVLAHRSDASVRNLVYLADYYHDYFSPHVAIVVVEHGASRSVDESALPTGCRHVQVNDSGPYDALHYFRAALETVPDRRFLFLTDSDIYLETLDFRANLRLLEQYDGTRAVHDLSDLTQDDTRRLLLSTNTRGIDNSRVSSCALEEINCFFFRRGAAQRWLEGSEDLRMFSSPGRALRLHPSP